MLYAKHNIEIQTHWISTKKNLLADMLLHSQYARVANEHFSLQIA